MAPIRPGGYGGAMMSSFQCAALAAAALMFTASAAGAEKRYGLTSFETIELNADVTIGLRGPGQLNIKYVEADRLSVAMIGNGTMTLVGSARQANMTLSGAGTLDAGELAVGELISDSEGAGDHRFRAIRTAAVTARGVGRTVVLGRPACTVRNVGSGSVECGAEK
jgi:hypothetical protein